MLYKKRAPVFLLVCSLIFTGLPAAAHNASANAQSADKAKESSAQTSADAAFNSGKSLLRRGRAAEALVQLEAALKLYQAAGKKRSEASTHDLLGELYERQGRYDLALEHFQKAHELYLGASTEMSASRLVASAVLTNFDAYRANLTLSKVGNMHWRRGSVAEARGAYSRMNVTKPDTSALGKVKKAGGLFGKITSITSGGVGAVTEAGSLAKQRVEAYHQTIVYAAYAMGMGRVDFHNESYDTARKHFESALAAAKGDIPVIGQLGQTKRYRTAARTSLGDIALRQGRYPDAVKLYGDAAKGAADDKRLDLMWPAQRGAGRARWLAAAQEADPSKAAKLREDALASYRDSLKTIETLRQGSVRADEARTTFLATTKNVFDEASSALAEMALMSAGASAAAGAPLEGAALQYAAEAFRVTEQSRARSLLDLLAETGAGVTEGVPAELLKRKQENLEQQQEIAGQLTGASITGEAPAKPLDELEKELDRLQAEYDSIENEIRTASPRYAALTSTQPLTLAEVQQRVLDDQTVLVEYSLGAEQSYLWAVTKSGVSLFKLPSRAALEKQVVDVRDQILPARLRRSILSTGADVQRGMALSQAAPFNEGAAKFAAASNALYQSALAPAAAVIKDKRLLVVADGALNYVPFESLVTSAAGAGDYSALPYLIKTNEIVYAPSASVVAAVRQQAASVTAQPRAILLVADPVFDETDPRARGAQAVAQNSAEAKERGLGLSSAVADVAAATGQQAPASGNVKLARLAGTRAESEQIAQAGKLNGYRADQWHDLEAREGNVEGRDLKPYRILHVATHGLLDTERPQFTGLVLSLVGDSAGDGFLRTDEIFNLRLGAPFVMLSACETGLGKEKRGEGVIGLTRAFMYAGAPTVGVSLWSVADRSTAELMSDFYKRLLSKPGTSSASAMRAAQIAMISGKKYSAPFYWAPFVIVGDWRF